MGVSKKRMRIMTKKIWIVLTLMMVLPAMIFMASCSKKKIYSDPSATQASDDAARAAERARQDALARQRAFDEQQLKDQAAGRAGRGRRRVGFRQIGDAKQFCFRRYLL